MWWGPHKHKFRVVRNNMESASSYWVFKSWSWMTGHLAQWWCWTLAQNFIPSFYSSSLTQDGFFSAFNFSSSRAAMFFSFPCFRENFCEFQDFLVSYSLCLSWPPGFPFPLPHLLRIWSVLDSQAEIGQGRQERRHNPWNKGVRNGARQLGPCFQLE